MGDLVWPPHMRLSFGGNIGVPPVEQWSNTLRFHFGGFLDGVPVVGAGEYEPTRDELEGMANALLPAVSAWMSDQSAQISGIATLKWLKFNWVQANGKQRDADTVLVETNVGNGSRGTNFPWFVTHALTLRSAARRGRAHAGRIYPPMAYPGAENSTSPYISAESALGMATALARALHNFEEKIDSITPPTFVLKPHAILVSPGDTSKGTQPLTANIIGVGCDRVPDVMHSRTASVPRSEVGPVVPGP